MLMDVGSSCKQWDGGCHTTGLSTVVWGIRRFGSARKGINSDSTADEVSGNPSLMDSGRGSICHMWWVYSMDAGEIGRISSGVSTSFLKLSYIEAILANDSVSKLIDGWIYMSCTTTRLLYRDIRIESDHEATIPSKDHCSHNGLHAVWTTHRKETASPLVRQFALVREGPCSKRTLAIQSCHLVHPIHNHEWCGERGRCSCIKRILKRTAWYTTCTPWTSLP